MPAALTGGIGVLRIFLLHLRNVKNHFRYVNDQFLPSAISFNYSLEEEN